MNKLLAILAIISIAVSSVAGAGNSVGCGTASTAGNPSTNCNSCGTTVAKWTVDTSPNCKVADCTVDPSTDLNGWMCKSCNGTPSAFASYSAGVYFKSGACVASCGSGYTADQTNTCIQNPPGNVVACGTASTAGSPSTDCNGCGATATVAKFTPATSPGCKVTDCTLDPSTNLNGWMCKSCSGVTGAHSAYSAGLLFKAGACVASCGTGFTADQNQICQPNPVPGANVACGTAAASGNSGNCNGCGATTAIQNLFTPAPTPNCVVADCTLNPGSNLNGWMCKSCNGATNAHSAYAAGKLLSGTTCVASCSTGQTADSNNICQAGSGSSTGSYLLSLAFTMLLLCLLI